MINDYNRNLTISQRHESIQIPRPKKEGGNKKLRSLACATRGDIEGQLPEADSLEQGASQRCLLGAHSGLLRMTRGQGRKAAVPSHEPPRSEASALSFSLQDHLTFLKTSEDSEEPLIEVILTIHTHCIPNEI